MSITAQDVAELAAKATDILGSARLGAAAPDMAVLIAQQAETIRDSELTKQGMYLQLREHEETIKRLEAVLIASQAMRADMLERAEFQEPARRIVACGASAWRNFCTTIDAATRQQSEGGAA